jgi:biopolymer transport protein ExbB/biopolymer transport protein TolQ
MEFFVAQMDFLELWDQMGVPVKILMFILVVMSMASVGVFFERLFTFIQATNQSKLFAPQVAKHLKDGKLKEAISVSQSKDYKYSHLGKVVLAGLQEYQFQQDSGVDLNKDDVVDGVHRAIQRAAALTSSDLKRGMGILATIGSTAVFVGLLATTLGVINAFQGIAATGSGGLGAVSGGISEALVGTAIGLFVAIPAVWFFNYLTGRLEYFAVEMDNSSSELVDYFIKKS